VREEVLVFRGQDRAADNGRDLVIPGDLAVFRGHFGERPAVDVVDVADGGKLEPAECLDVGQAGSVEADVVDSPGNQGGRNNGRRNQALIAPRRQGNCRDGYSGFLRAAVKAAAHTCLSQPRPAIAPAAKPRRKSRERKPPGTGALVPPATAIPTAAAKQQHNDYDD